MMCMAALSREKIALVAFTCLIILGFGILVSYLSTGYSWNVAATNIDDATGSMDDYVAVLYPGTVALDSKDKTDPIPEAGILPDAEEGLEETPEIEKEVEALEAQRASAVTTLTTKVSKLEVEDVKESYEEKHAAVLALDLLNLPQYEDSQILKRGENRFGVLSVKETDTPFKIERQIAYLERHSVDFIVALVPERTLVERVSGIDIVISSQEEKLFITGEVINDTFYVSAPTVGSVGVILISPSNVVSAKVISEL